MDHTDSLRRHSSSARHHRRHSSAGTVREVLGGIFHRPSEQDPDEDAHSHGHSRRSSGSHSRRSSGNGPAQEREESVDGIKEMPPRATFMLYDDPDDPDDDKGGSGDYTGTARPPPPLETAASYTAQLADTPVPGMWSCGAPGSDAAAAAGAGSGAPRTNVPLEPDEYAEKSMPWVFEQLRMGERPFSALFSNQIGYTTITDADGGPPDEASQQATRKRMCKQAFRVLKGQVSEARVGIQKDAALPDLAEYCQPGGATDYARYACDMARHYADTQLSYKLDFRHSVTDPCKLDRVLTTLHRLVGVSAPYQRLLMWLFHLARWDNPRVSLSWCAVYFTLLYYNLITLSLCLAPAFVVVYHRLRPSQAYDWLGFERPETSLIPSKVFQEAASGTIAKGLIANHMWGMWNDTLGSHVHFVLADVTDWMERMKNCATWKRPWASRVMVLVLACMGIVAYLLPPGAFQKLLGTAAGVQFFILTPLQLHHPRYRRMMWIIDLLLWHAPSDVELALDMLYEPTTQQQPGEAAAPLQQQRQQEQTCYGQLRVWLRTLAADMRHAFNPFAKERGYPVMVLQTASSAALDLMSDDVASELGLSGVISMGKHLGKSILRDDDAESSDEDQYTGLGGPDCSHVMSVMGEAEEREWAQQHGLPKRRASKALSIRSFGTLDADCIISPPADMRELGLEPHMPVGDADHDNQLEPVPEAASPLSSHSPPSGGSSGKRNSADSMRDSASATHERRGSLSAWARDISSRFQERRRSSLANKHGDSGSDAKKRKDSGAHPLDSARPTLQRTGAISVAGNEDRFTHHRGRFSVDDRDDMFAEYQEVARELGISPHTAASSSIGSSNSGAATPLTTAPSGSTPRISRTGSLELMREANKLESMRSKDARSSGDTFDLKSLFAFRCLHQGRYGTLFVTPEQFVFRRSRMMGGRRSSVSSYRLSSVMAIRKAVSGIGKSHGVQMLLSSGKTCSFYGLSKRDDIFGFLLVRCGNSHVF